MDITEAVKSVLTLNYANFTGRAGRPEYWWWVLFAVVASLILGLVDRMIGMQILGTIFMQILGTIFMLATIIPGIAVGVRRLHDLGKSGWWLLISFTIIGAFVLLYWFTQPGERDNQYGAYVAV